MAGIDKANIAAIVHFSHDAVGSGAYQAESVLDSFGPQCFNNRLTGAHLCHGFPHWLTSENFA